MKLWHKGTDTNKRIEEFTVGDDRDTDLLLAKYDVLGSIAHAIMLEDIGLVSKAELKALLNELHNIYHTILEGKFTITEGIEDVHSQIEFLLTQKLGNTGKKIHTARSRNDQVLLDIKLFTREKMLLLGNSVAGLFDVLIKLSEKHKNIFMPGYTHLQAAMPSTFGLWFGAYAESLTDDLQLLLAAFRIVNQNPLGSAAGYGSSFPVNRKLTTELLGFEQMNYNVIYAQMGRGKVERIVSYAIGSIASSLSKLAYDICLFVNQNFNFITLPEEFTTGSSIMPHKKNPDVFELIRGKCNKIIAHTNEMTLVSNNLPSGYFRDYQILKKTYLESFDTLNDCLDIACFALPEIKVNKELIKDKKYNDLFSVEEVNKEVLKGMSFRDAYKLIGNKIKSGQYTPDKNISHTHEGSAGNLCNEQIQNKFECIFTDFNGDLVREAEKKLLKLAEQ
jgi:argininosuccinate lyase